MAFAARVLEHGKLALEQAQVPEGYFAGAQQRVVHCVVVGDKAPLDDPPPALLHESLLPANYSVYSADFELEQSCTPDASVFVGGKLETRDLVVLAVAMVQCTALDRRPGLLFWSGDSLELLVGDAPLASMETDFFDSRVASRFEAAWFVDQDDTEEERSARKLVASHERNAGFGRLPLHVLENDYMVSRQGPMCFLRLDGPRDEREREQLQGVASAAAAHKRARPAELLADPTNRRLRATFQRKPLPTAPPAADELPLPGPWLAAVVAAASPTEYYGVQLERTALDMDSPPVWLEELRAAELAHPKGVLGEDSAADPTQRQAPNALTEVFARTGKNCTLAQIAVCHDTESRAVVLSSAFGATVAAALCVQCKEQKPREAVLEAAAYAHDKGAVLVLDASQGRLVGATVAGARGCWKVDADGVVRFLLARWAAPFVFDGENIFEVAISGFKRDRLFCSADFEHAASISVCQRMLRLENRVSAVELGAAAPGEGGARKRAARSPCAQAEAPSALARKRARQELQLASR